MTEQRHWPRGTVELELGTALVGKRVVHFGKLGGELADIEPG